MKKLFSRVCLAAVFLACELTAQSPEIVVVVNKANPANSLSRAQLKKLIMGTMEKWPNGTRVTVMTTMPGTPERTGALRMCCGMTEQQMKADNIHAAFVGEGRHEPRRCRTARRSAAWCRLCPVPSDSSPRRICATRLKC